MTRMRVRLEVLSIVFAVGCGGEPFGMADDPPDVGSPATLTFDAGSPVVDAGASPREAQVEPSVDAMVVGHVEAGEPEAEASIVDAAIDVAPPPSTTVCCLRPNGNAVCIDQPWWCCSNDACGGSANCGAKNSDGSNFCASQMGAKCGLIGAPTSGTVGLCP